MSNPNAKPDPAKAEKTAPSGTKSTSAFAAAVLSKGGEIHRIGDGAGGYFEIAIIAPGALRPKSEGGRN